MSDFPRVGHIAVTVKNLAVSVPWYERLFGAEPVVDEDEEGGTYHHTLFLIGDVLIGLHQFVPDVAQDGDASEFRPGLEHIGFHVGSRADLEAWGARLDDLGIEHGKVLDRPYGSGLAFRDPDNIQLEFFAPSG